MEFRACHKAIQEHAIVIIGNVQVAVCIANVKSVDLGLRRHASVCVGLVARDASTGLITQVGIDASLAKNIFAIIIRAVEVIVPSAGGIVAGVICIIIVPDPIAGVSIVLAKKCAQLVSEHNGLRGVVDFPNHNARHVSPMSSFIVLVKVGGMVDCLVRNDFAETVVERRWYNRILVVNSSCHLEVHPTRFAERKVKRTTH